MIAKDDTYTRKNNCSGVRVVTVGCMNVVVNCEIFDRSLDICRNQTDEALAAAGVAVQLNCLPNEKTK